MKLRDVPWPVVEFLVIFALVTWLFDREVTPVSVIVFGIGYTIADTLGNILGRYLDRRRTIRALEKWL